MQPHIRVDSYHRDILNDCRNIVHATFYKVRDSSQESCLALVNALLPFEGVTEELI